MPKGENLKPYHFKKGGSSPNPKGRGKGNISLKRKLKEALDKIHEGTGTRYDELFVQATMKDGIKQDGQSRRLVWNYVEGMPIQNTDITSGGEKIIPIYGQNSIQGHTSDEKDIQSTEEDKSSGGGDIGK